VSLLHNTAQNSCGRTTTGKENSVQSKAYGANTQHLSY